MRKAVFLDRDGTINIEKGYLSKIEDFEYFDGALDGMGRLQAMGFCLVIITNQSGIARGYYSETDYETLTEWMQSDLKKRGIEIAGTYHCPHHPNGTVSRYAITCKCRKPGTELFYKAARELSVTFSGSVAIGDKMRDLAICKETETRGILLSENAVEEDGVVCCKNWQEIPDIIKEWKNNE